MAAVSCPREGELLDLVVIGQWPARADTALREHVACCEVCADLATTAVAIAELGEATGAEVRVPDASVVWYRAAVEARRVATVRATAPMFLAEAAAVVAVAAFAWMFRGSVLPWAAGAWTEFARILRAAAPTAESLTLAGIETQSSTLRWAVIALAGWTAAFVPVAFYLARLADRGADPKSPQRGQP